MHGKRCNVMKQLKGSQFSETWTETAAGVFVDIGIALSWLIGKVFMGKPERTLGCFRWMSYKRWMAMFRFLVGYCVCMVVKKCIRDKFTSRYGGKAWWLVWVSWFWTDLWCHIPLVRLKTKAHNL